MRTASNFDRPHANQTALNNLRVVAGQGFLPAIENIYFAGVKVVQGILNGWESQFEAGIKPTNYVGDIFGTLGGQPDFGPVIVPVNTPATYARKNTTK